MFNNVSPLKSCSLWDNVEKYGRARQATVDNIIRWMRIACCITKARNTHSEDVVRIAFPLQQWLHEHSSMLRLYVHCLSCCRSLMSFYQPREGENFVFWKRKAVNILWTGNSIMYCTFSFPTVLCVFVVRITVILSESFIIVLKQLCFPVVQ
jgi:hypothetical protein